MSVVVHPDGQSRCSWAGPDQIYIDYHDQEWGRPVREQQALFEHLCLEAFQAGLSWITILKRREGFRSAFAGFDIGQVADFDEQKISELKINSAIIRNEQKIRAVVHNARLVREGSLNLADIFWKFAPDQPLTKAAGFTWKITSPESDDLSRELKRLGFKFVGSTSMYAMMQSAGLIRDHAPGCFRRTEDIEDLKAG